MSFPFTEISWMWWSSFNSEREIWEYVFLLIYPWIPDESRPNLFLFSSLYNSVKGLKQERGTKRKGAVNLHASANLVHYPSQGGWKDDTQRHTKDPAMYAIFGIVCTKQHSAAIIRGSPCVMSIESTDSWQGIRIFGWDKLLLTFRICRRLFQAL